MSCSYQYLSCGFRVTKKLCRGGKGGRAPRSLSLVQLGTLGHALVHEDDLAAAGVVGGGQQHTVGGYARDTGGSQVRKNDDLFAQQLVSGVVVLDGGHDDALANTVVERQLVAGVRLADLLHLDDLANANIHLAEIVDGDHIGGDGLYGIGIAVNLLNGCVGGGLGIGYGLISGDLILGLTKGEIQQTHVASGIDGVKEQVFF